MPKGTSRLGARSLATNIRICRCPRGHAELRAQQRCQSLLDELAFVAERLDDPLAAKAAQAIQDYVAVRVRRPGWDGLVTFEGN